MPVEEVPTKVKLHCPSLSKTVAFEAREEQRLDLGSIARAFGLEPWSVRLNGRFISRGVDLISSSVTWRSLLRFFSSKGLSTGKDDGGPIIVDGKLLMVGNKSKRSSRSGRVLEKSGNNFAREALLSTKMDWICEKLCYWVFFLQDHRILSTHLRMVMEELSLKEMPSISLNARNSSVKVARVEFLSYSLDFELFALTVPEL